MSLILALFLQSASPPVAGPSIDVESLLRDLLDRRSLARLAEPSFVGSQASSYDRASISPDKAWFANADAGQFVRIETTDGRTEGVLLDVEGPGAIVRIWSANPAGTLRFYLDGSQAPAIAEDMASFFGGQGKIPPPLSEETSRGWNLYLPIPYARHCKITCDAPKDLYYHVGYRTYAAAAHVATCTAAAIEQAAPAMRRVCEAWKHPGEGDDRAGVDAFTYSLSSEDPKAALVSVDPRGNRGSRAITEISFRIEADDLALALRRAVLRVRFDGEETIVCPLGDFFASAPGLNPYRSWPITAAAGADVPVGRPGSQGDFACRWIMPYRKDVDLSIENHGDRSLHVAGLVKTEPWTWDDRSLHFHASWRSSGPVSSRPIRDWTHLQVRGSGLFVGDMLSIANPVKAWWGEGDEKIYVDGEAFPSHFGTGTEDYYGYAWCSTKLFQSPLHAQTRCDGPGNFGITSVNRFRSLDAIPFTKSLRFDMELWHWRECVVEMAATTFYYARPGAEDDAPAILEPDLRVPRPEWKPFRVADAIEAESARVVDSSPGTAWEIQDLDDEHWSGGKHLWVRANAIGEFVELAVPIAKPGRREVVVFPTQSFDYGTVQFSVDGVRAGAPIATFNAEAHAVGAPRPVALGAFDLGDEMRLRVELVATDARADPPRTFFGLDCVVVK